MTIPWTVRLAFRQLWTAATVAAVVLAFCAGLLVGSATEDPPALPPPTPSPSEIVWTAPPTPEASPSPRSTPTRAARSHRSSLRWDLLRRCESGGHGGYKANTGNGYYGAYQGDLRTWGRYRGYARPDLAPPAVQDEWARKLYADRGSQPWPVCGRLLRR